MRAGPLAIEDKSWHLNRMAIDSSYGCVVSAYAVLSDVRVVFLTQPDHRNTFIALPDEFERLQEEGRSSRQRRPRAIAEEVVDTLAQGSGGFYT